VSALFLTSTLAIALFGSAPVGVTRVEGGGLTLASLMNLSAYLVPLLALILGAGAIIDEKRRGVLDLVLVYPISTGEYFAGAFVGQFLALAAALVLSYVPTGVVLHFAVGADAVEFLLLLGLALLLGAVFLAISFLVSILTRDRSRGLASSLLVWIVAVFIFDLVLVGGLVAYPGQVPAALFGFLLLLNPIDVFRLICFKWVGSAATPLGLATVMLPVPTAVLLAALAFWALVPFVLSYLMFRRRVATDRLV
jgi:Cu-processing system permease protein